MADMKSCAWARVNEANQKYHDKEWGVPVHDDRQMFEHLSLECMQCGLSWDLMLKKREILRRCFSDFDFDVVAGYGDSEIKSILETEGMIRSQRKIEAIIHNARCFQNIRQEFGSFCEYLWSYTKGKTILYKGHEKGRVPVSNGLSAKISKDLKKRGFKYVGPVTIYSHLQACGIINDHGENCPCYKKINEAHPTVTKRRDEEVY